MSGLLDTKLAGLNRPQQSRPISFAGLSRGIAQAKFEGALAASGFDGNVSPSAPSALLQQYAGIKFAGASDLLNRIQASEQKRFTGAKEVMSFTDYLDEVYENPRKHLRNSSQYTVDAIDFFNQETGVGQEPHSLMGRRVKSLSFANRPWLSPLLQDRTSIQGLDITLNEIYSELKKNAAKANPNRMIVLHGPNGTAKTMLVETLFESLEQYSKKDDGALYRFNWVFEEDMSDDLEALGYRPPVTAERANITDDYQANNDGLYKSKDLAVIIPANLNTNPVFLLDKSAREQMIRDLAGEGKIDESFNKDYLLQGRLDSSSEKIYNALLRYYEGDVGKVLNHVQVERYALSQQGREGLSVVAANTPDAQMQTMTSEVDFTKLPSGIQEVFRTAGLVNIKGPLPDANRGHIFYDDKWKDGRVDLSMLRIAEKGKMTMGNVEAYLDTVMWATTNDINVSALQQSAEWDSFRGRISFIPVPYVRQYKSAANIYKFKLDGAFPKDGNRIVGPHVLETFGMWATMSYLFPPKKMDFKEIAPSDRDLFKKALKKVQDKMIFKAMLYQGDDLNQFALRPEEAEFTREEQNVLKKYLRLIADEYTLGVGDNKFLFYEGGTGLEPREAEKLLLAAAAANTGTDFTVVELFDFLDEKLKTSLQYEEKNKAYMGQAQSALAELRRAGRSLMGIDEIPDVEKDFQSAKENLEEVKEHTRKQIRYDVQQALGLLKSPTDHAANLRKYLDHVFAESQKGQVSRQYRDPNISADPNPQFMAELEKIIKDDPVSAKDFRRQVILRMGQWQSQNKGDLTEEVVAEVFGDLIRKMTTKDVDETKGKLNDFLTDVDWYFANHKAGKKVHVDPLNRDRMARVERAIVNLKRGNDGYTDKTIPKMLNFAFDEAFRKWVASGTESAATAAAAAATGKNQPRR